METEVIQVVSLLPENLQEITERLDALTTLLSECKNILIVIQSALATLITVSEYILLLGILTIGVVVALQIVNKIIFQRS